MLAEPLISITPLSILAGVVTGTLPFLGLVITKEQKVSEFRQEWIDQLRIDLASLVARAHQIHAYTLMRGNATDLEIWNATREDFLELNQASTRIKLRLNPDECESKLILRSMNDMEKLFKDFKTPAPIESIDEIVNAIERDAPVLLKKEWGRVKQGEPTYRKTKWGTGVLLLLSLVGYLVLIGISIFKAIHR